MAQPQQPLEIFLIRSYFNKNHKRRPQLPKSWAGFMSLPTKDHPQQIKGPLSSLAALRPPQYYDYGLDSRYIVLEPHIRMTKEVDWHLISTLRYEFIDGAKPHRYTLEISEDGLSHGAVTLEFAKPWEFLHRPESLLKNMTSNLTDEEKLDILNKPTGTFKLVFSKSFVYIEDMLGQLVTTTGEGSNPLPVSRLEAIQLSALPLFRKTSLSMLVNFLSNCSATRAWSLQQLPVVKNFLLRIARQPAVDPESKQQLIQQLKEEFLGQYAWCFENVIARLVSEFNTDEMEEQSADKIRNQEALTAFTEYLRRLSQFCSSTGTSAEAIIAAFEEPTTPGWQKAGSLLQAMHATNMQWEHHLATLEKVLTEKSDIAKAISASQQDVARKHGLFWRDCQLPFDLTDSLLKAFIKSTVPPLVIYDTVNLRPVWGGNHIPKEILSFRSFTVVVTSSKLAWVNDASPQDLMLDGSRWNTIDIKEFEDKVKHIKVGHDSADKYGRCLFATHQKLVVVSLRPLRLKQNPKSSILLNVADIPNPPNPSDRLKSGLQHITRNDTMMAGIVSKSELFVVRIRNTGSVTPVWLTSLDCLHTAWLEMDFANQLDSVMSNTDKKTFTHKVNGCHFLPNNPNVLFLECSSTNDKSRKQTHFLAAVRFRCVPFSQSEPFGRIEMANTDYHDFSPISTCNLRLFDYRGLDIIFLRTLVEKHSLIVVHNGKFVKVTQIVVGTGTNLDNVWGTSWHPAKVYFDPKKLTFATQTAHGRYGEGYTISVHPLKLLLN